MEKFILNNQWLKLEDIQTILGKNQKIDLGETARKAIIDCRTYLDEKIESSDRLYYGINTGFGSLCDTAISKDDLTTLQRNLVISHACGTGETIKNELVKCMLLLKIIGLAKGHSGIRLETIERLIFFFNEDILPIIYEQGSLGASGDLAPLAHLSLPLIGEGFVWYKNEIHPSKVVLAEFGLTPLELGAKEGLALLNGTQFMSAHATLGWIHSMQLWENWITVSSISLDAYDGRMEPFGHSLHEIRNHSGQKVVAEKMRTCLADSEIAKQEKKHVQDPYSFRCIPQVHGATWDALQYAKTVFENEINAVTDNPTIFPEEDLIVSGGNFHGQPLAITLDFLSIAMAEMGSISERRVYKLISGTRGLPPFLVAEPGLNSGFMIVQYTCASIVSQNKQYCTPASIDSIDSSNGQEDHVSMGANAATKFMKVLENCYTIQGIELLTGIQALDFRKPLKSSDTNEKLRTDLREKISFINKDEFIQPKIEEARNFVINMKYI
jgi:histidine ammonia-lyase